MPPRPAAARSRLQPRLRRLLVAAADPPEGSRPIAPFALVGSIHYVGTKRIAAYIRARGVPLDRVRLILVTLAHPDAADVIGRARRGALVDRALWSAMLAGARREFDAELARQSRLARQEHAP